MDRLYGKMDQHKTITDFTLCTSKQTSSRHTAEKWNHTSIHNSQNLLESLINIPETTVLKPNEFIWPSKNIG